MFPKPVAPHSVIGNDGKIIWARNERSTTLVERPTVLALYWAAHVHMAILRLQERDDIDYRGLQYAVKYHSKSEPSFTLQGTADADRHTLFKGRVVGLEEAVTRIFSFEYFQRDTHVLFLDLKPKDLRRISVNENDQQVQMDQIAKYFHRPKQLERLSILEFFSRYTITVTTGTNEDIDEHRRLDPQRPFRSLQKDSTWEADNLCLDEDRASRDGLLLFRDPSLPNARQLKCSKNFKPWILTLRKPDPLRKPMLWLFMYLLMSGCWRSEDEMMAGCRNYDDAVIRHGLLIPDFLDPVSIPIRAFIQWAVLDTRVDLLELESAVALMINNGVSPRTITDAVDAVTISQPEQRMVARIIHSAVHLSLQIAATDHHPPSSIAQYYDLSKYLTPPLPESARRLALGGRRTNRADCKFL
jgi:hypothetical protein